MMSPDRITQLEKYYEEDPLDPFNAYALALEYMRVDTAKSRKHFEMLLDNHPDYLPTYYHAAKLFQELGDVEKAALVFEQGIALARESNDQKALRELKSAYDEMMFE
jgi:tetratricopeptide (TPR) repeat protein